MPESTPKDPAKEREMAQKFVQFVMMQAQNVLYLLGKIPTPDGRALPPDLASAKMFIDQLEAIEFKTKGNLSSQESKLLQDTLAQLRLVFVEASGGTPPSMMPDRSSAYNFPGDDAPLDEDDFGGEPPAPAAPPASATTPPSPPKPTSAPEESKVKFSKSYG
jgi:hypothetical protein